MLTGKAAEEFDARVRRVRKEWEELFDESMPWGYEVSGPQVPILEECVRIKSTKPLKDYIDSLPPERLY